MPGELAIERESLARFRAGEGPAFLEVMRAYRGLVRGVVCGFFHDAFRQEEALQEVWLLAFRQREQLDPGRLDEFEGWLRALARNRCIDLLRREQRALRHEVPADPGLLEEEIAVAGDQEGRFELQELRSALVEFRARLKPRLRALFELCFVQGKDCAEAGRELSLGRIRCRYMKRVIAARARRSPRLLRALGIRGGEGTGHV